MNIFIRFLNDEAGATAIEYGLIAALIAVGIIAGVSSLGGGVNSIFNKLGTKMNGVAVP
jgi:pilus assembly protein Flp/PilA